MGDLCAYVHGMGCDTYISSREPRSLSLTVRRIRLRGELSFTDVLSICMGLRCGHMMWSYGVVIWCGDMVWACREDLI